jgi:hypothetical protein
VTRPLVPVRSDLARAFDEAMFNIYRQAKADVGYSATRFLGMLNEHKGIETARRLLPAMSDGFVALHQAERLDLTVEYLVLQEKWRPLFTDAELTMARTRLRDCGMSL